MAFKILSYVRRKASGSYSRSWATGTDTGCESAFLFGDQQVDCLLGNS